MVDYSQDAVIAPTLWKARDQVHGYLCKWWGIGGNCYFIQGGSGFVCEVFVLLAGRASLHILFNPLLHTWPVEAL
jgi:hypothetical protein